MATIKMCTDIPQSKVLAEILPLESADMHWQYIEEDNGQLQWFCFPKDFSINQNNMVSAWSLAALLDVIPEIINFEDDESDYALEILKEGDLYYLSYGNPLEGDKLNIEPQENFVDACVAMIEKLNELNLL